MSNRNTGFNGAQEEREVDPDCVIITPKELLAQHGQEFKPVSKNVEHGEQVGPEEPKGKTKAKAKQLSQDIKFAEEIYNVYKGKLAFYGDHFYSLDKNFGWTKVTDNVIKRCTLARGRDGSKSIAIVLQQFCAVPSLSENTEPTIYWEHSGKWKDDWKSVKLDRSQILFADGIFDCETGEFEKVEDKIIFGPRLTVPYDVEDSRNAEFETMVARMFPNPETRRHFQEVAGLVLQPHYTMRGQVVLVGPTMCGKTTLATAIGCAPGGPCGKGDMSEQQLIKDQWAKANLLNKFINISDDSPRVSGWPGFAKGYTSGRMVLRVMWKMPITVAATAKLWSTCNEMQDTSDASGAMAGRMIPFMVHGQVQKREQDTSCMTDSYWSGWAARRGIVNWMLEGTKRYWERGGCFDEPESWMAEKMGLDGEGDPLEGWLRENLVAGTAEAFITKEELEQKMPATVLPRSRADQIIPTYLKRLFGSESIRMRQGEGKKRVYTGIAWA